MRESAREMVKPGRLRPGSRVALIAPAGPVDDARVENALRTCASLQLEGILGESARSQTGYLAGSDDARASDFQHAIEDDDIDAIWALRGGYGTVRLLPRLDLSRMRATPKAFIGFSDNTSIHLALSHLGILSFHGPHAGAEFPDFTRQWFERMLFDGSPAELTAPADAALVTWRGGIGEGRLLGGNLAILAAAEGTPNAMSSRGAILFIEEIAEPPYRIDRLMMQMIQSGALDDVAGIIVGQFKDCDGTGNALDVVRDELMRFGIPIVANAPIGHVADNWTLPVGARVRIDADGARVFILESVNSDE